MNLRISTPSMEIIKLPWTYSPEWFVASFPSELYGMFWNGWICISQSSLRIGN